VVAAAVAKGGSLTDFPAAAVDVDHPARCREAVAAPAGDAGAAEEGRDVGPDCALRVEGEEVGVKVSWPGAGMNVDIPTKTGSPGIDFECRARLRGEGVQRYKGTLDAAACLPRTPALGAYSDRSMPLQYQCEKTTRLHSSARCKCF
jgi:hypothetical protein